MCSTSSLTDGRDGVWPVSMLDYQSDFIKYVRLLVPDFVMSTRRELRIPSYPGIATSNRSSVMVVDETSMAYLGMYKSLYQAITGLDWMTSIRERPEGSLASS